MPKNLDGLTVGHCWQKDPGAFHFVQVPNASGDIVEIAVVKKKIHMFYLFGNPDYDLKLFQLE